MSDWTLDRFDPLADLAALKDAARAYLEASTAQGRVLRGIDIECNHCGLDAEYNVHEDDCLYRQSREALEELL